MKQHSVVFAFLFSVVLSSCDSQAKQANKNNDVAPTPPADTATAVAAYTLTPAYPNLTFNLPVELTSPNDGTDRVFVIAQEGKIHVFPNKADVKDAPVFLDITSKVVSGGERGLLGLAFHPDFKTNGYFYVNYTRGNPLETAISRFKVSANNPNKVDPATEEVLLTYRQPYSNHNGGKVAFGNDGYLYIAAGDGGSGGDPQNNGQNRKELLGKIIRIDVNNTSGNRKYAIPADNPFRGNTEGFREEIYAYGLRNPWRFSFDRTTGLLWAGDVGQNKIEEVDIIEKGGNYGWRIMEADECFEKGTCDESNLMLPIHTYQQGSDTGRSITGGYVCRDKSLAGLEGKYIYADYVSGNIWALTFNGKKKVSNQLITKMTGPVSSFGEDSKNGLYVINYSDGKIYKFAAGK